MGGEDIGGSMGVKGALWLCAPNLFHFHTVLDKKSCQVIGFQALFRDLRPLPPRLGNLRSATGGDSANNKMSTLNNIYHDNKSYTIDNNC